ncbi:histidine-rich glycoprotein-like [Gymnodraco acuticeps]|uniref:Histidine-rich glycoprotein-like n=1 Tax=Gymnodraco acuticeps TaxID=8218 RepID=A0A6P8UU26_GYMAC|nr:histidine-rich glycoprotein-like [Gymnodraco acuticeps]
MAKKNITVTDAPEIIFASTREHGASEPEGFDSSEEEEYSKYYKRFHICLGLAAHRRHISRSQNLQLCLPPGQDTLWLKGLHHCHHHQGHHHQGPADQHHYSCLHLHLCLPSGQDTPRHKGLHHSHQHQLSQQGGLLEHTYPPHIHNHQPGEQGGLVEHTYLPHSHQHQPGTIKRTSLQHSHHHPHSSQSHCLGRQTKTMPLLPLSLHL